MTDSEGNDIPLKTQAGRWLFSQGVSTVLLFAIFVSIAWLGKYLIVDGIPKHLEQIQAGYERISVEHVKARREDREAFTSSLGELKSTIKENTEATRRLTESRRDEQRLLNRRDSSTSSPN